MSDADIDGFHICSLLEKMFVLYYPQLIEAGMVYRAVPPLYGIGTGSKAKYFTEQKDMVKYVQRTFTSKYTLKDANNKALITNKEITDLLITNEVYLFHMNDISNHFALYPELLETFLYHYISNNDSINISKLTKEINSKYRFMNTKLVNGVPVIDGTIDECRSLIGNKQFIDECKPIIDILHNNKSLYYYIDNEKKTIYEVMNLYAASYPRNVRRFKGLGEMEKEELAQSTIHPSMDRTLIRYTVDDIKETVNIIRDYDSDTKKILNLVGTVRREDL